MNVGGTTRDQYLIKNLKERNEIHVIQYTQPYENTIRSFLNPRFLIGSLKDWTIFKDGIYHHHLRHIYFTRFNQVLKINNRIFKNKIKKIVKNYGIDIIICAPNHYLHGYPPFDISVPIIFDYLDFLHESNNMNKENTKILSEYCKNSSKILCVANTLLESIDHKYQEKAIYLPNGIDLNFFRADQNFKNQNDTKIVSLIGLGCTESTFYLDIFPEIKKDIENIKMLLVGGGIKFPLIYNYISNKKNREDYILTGYIPYNQIRDYFIMSDVGLYPSIINRYFDSATPIKIMEYSAVHKPVVSTDLKEVRSLNFPNVFLAKPNVKDYIKKIKQALNYEGGFPNLDELDWKFLSKKLEKVIHNI